MSYNFVKGDLFEIIKYGDYNSILHGCNCFHTMGAGFAKQIAERYPEAVEADLKTVYGAIEKLGSWSAALVDNDNYVVFNLYTQYKISHTKDVFEYSAFDLILRKLRLFHETSATRRNFIMPMIGSGLAHGNWPLIENIIKKHAKVLDITVVKYQK